MVTKGDDKMNKDVAKKGITALVLGTTAYLTGVSLDNETMAEFFKYATMPEYAAVAKLIGAATCAASLAAMAQNTLHGIVDSFYKKEDKKPGPTNSY